MFFKKKRFHVDELEFISKDNCIWTSLEIDFYGIAGGSLTRDNIIFNSIRDVVKYIENNKGN